MSRRQSLGRWGEDLALAVLEKRGHTLEARNYRCEYGEIDLVTRQGGELVFVEVKTRSNTRYGRPELAVTPRKQAHLMNSALHYIGTHVTEELPWRIDVVSVLRHPDGTAKVEVFEDAVRG